MDYSYIDGLLERYWQCAASVEEEETLRAFFRQKEIPARFERWRPLFGYTAEAREDGLGADFDSRMIGLTEGAARPAAGRTVVRARRIPLHERLRPLLRAAAAVAIALTLGNAAQHSFRDDSTPAPDYNYATYKDTYDDPQAAYDKVSGAFKDMSDGLRRQAEADSAAIAAKNGGEL